MLQISKGFVFVLVVLAAVTLSLLGIFNFLTISQLSLEMSLLLFIMVTVLMIVGYMLGLIVIAYLGIFILVRLRLKKG